MADASTAKTARASQEEQRQRDERRRVLDAESAATYRRFTDSIKRTSQAEMDRALRHGS